MNRSIITAFFISLLALLAFVLGAVTQAATAAPPAQSITYHAGCAPFVAMPSGPSGVAGWRIFITKVGLYDSQTALKCVYLSPEYNQNPPPDDAYLNGCPAFVEADGGKWRLWVVKFGMRGPEAALKCIYTRIA